MLTPLRRLRTAAAVFPGLAMLSACSPVPRATTILHVTVGLGLTALLIAAAVAWLFVSLREHRSYPLDEKSEHFTDFDNDSHNRGDIDHASTTKADHARR